MTKHKDLAVRLNPEQAGIMLSALDSLPDSEKRKITYNKLRKDVELIKSMWDKRMRDDKLKKSKTK